MNNINDLNNFLSEKKVTVKRRYTEAHPAKNVSTLARVRSSILEAIADGHITEEEMSRILSELKAHKRWLNRNKTLFNVSEDQAGIKTFSLSPYGHRVKNATAIKKTTVINEALTVPHKEKGKKPVNMFVGRFQPFTLGHVKVFEKMYKENGLPVVVYMVRGGKADPEKRPFDEDMQQAMFAKMKKQYPFLEASFVVPNGAIDTMFAAARPVYEPMMWGYGTDRKKAYGNMINKQSYRDDLGVDPSFKGYEIKRGDENISASKVRNALKIDDEQTFKKMTPKSIHGFYKPLQTIMQPIKENNNMKNLKSLNDFGVNESINEAFKFNERQVKDVADKIAQAIAKMDKMKTEVHDIEFDKGRGAGFEISMDGEKYEGGSYTVRPNGDVVNSAIGNSFPNAVYAKIGDTDIKKIIKNIKMYESLDSESVNEEYIEVMDIPSMLKHMSAIEMQWLDWKRGPETKKGDIKPAAKELKGYLRSWFQNNIK